MATNWTRLFTISLCAKRSFTWVVQFVVMLQWVDFYVILMLESVFFLMRFFFTIFGLFFFPRQSRVEGSNSRVTMRTGMMIVHLAIIIPDFDGTRPQNYDTEAEQPTLSDLLLGASAGHGCFCVLPAAGAGHTFWVSLVDDDCFFVNCDQRRASRRRREEHLVRARIVICILVVMAIWRLFAFSYLFLPSLIFFFALSFPILLQQSLSHLRVLILFNLLILQILMLPLEVSDAAPIKTMDVVLDFISKVCMCHCHLRLAHMAKDLRRWSPLISVVHRVMQTCQPGVLIPH